MRLSFGTCDFLDIEGVVDERELILGCEARFDQWEAAEFRIDQVMDDAEPVGALGVSFARVVFQVAVVFDERGG
jgi:hypothetical protein